MDSPIIIAALFACIIAAVMIAEAGRIALLDLLAAGIGVILAYHYGSWTAWILALPFAILMLFRALKLASEGGAR